MKNFLNRINRIENIFLIAAFIALIVGLFLPKSGANVLMDEIFEVLLWWFIGGYAICKVVEVRNAGTVAQKRGRIIIVIVGMFLCTWISRNVVIDMISGTDEMVLHNAEVSRYQGFAGALTSHYHLTGENDKGNTARFEISKDDYNEYINGGTVVVVYYPETKRVVELRWQF